MDTPSHRYTEHLGDKRSADPRRLSPHTTDDASLDELRREWRRLYCSEPPRISRDLLIRGIGYRLQELQYGGLGKSTRRKLKTLAKMFRTTGQVAPDPGLSLKPGARLVREWRDRTHTVTVTEEGFEYAGVSYPSLTKIAKAITGAHGLVPVFLASRVRAHRAPTKTIMTESQKTSRRPSKRLRCAIYTRKSSEEGLDQAFNSLDAQREACAAFILSQKHEGWGVLPTLYDDGGLSGGTMDRPALKRLLADIGAGKVDVVVVYKIDRLTRSLFDFAKIVEAFDAHRVSFVSITQQFNTTTSMGRLTLNVLLSFAQFEREVAGERIRDKIAASKKKGMWMGGLPSLGYDVQNRKLVVNEEEAGAVVHIFRRYVELRSVRVLQEELDVAGIRSKRRIMADGTPFGGQKLSRGALYLMLQNRIYRGEITHKDNAYPGEHPAIVDKALWDQVQATLAENRVNRATGSDAKFPSLLAGLAFDETGERLTPTHAVKKGTRYRYYVSRSLIIRAAKDRSKGRRIPAANLESLVITRLRAFLANQGAILDAIRDEHADGPGQKRLIGRGREIAEELGTLAPDRIRAMLMALLSRVDIRPDRVDIKVRRRQLIEQLHAQSIASSTAAGKPDSASHDTLTLTVKARLQRVGREMRMLVENADDQTSADPGLLRIIARAHDFQERLMQDMNLTVPAIANQERLSTGYLSRLLRLPSLAPDIIAAFVNGKHPPQLTAKKLMRLALQISVDWTEQRKLLGFHE